MNLCLILLSYTTFLHGRDSLKTIKSNVVQDYVCFARGRHITVKCMNIKYTVQWLAGDTPAMTKQYTYISITTVCPLSTFLTQAQLPQIIRLI